MSTETADVVIVGGGIEGAAAAWALARRGVTDVLVAERNTVGSGMTGKSSGIVRCHYGVSSLAAMATVGLEVFEKPEQFFGDGVTDIGFRQTGYVVGVGEPNVDSLRKSLAAQRAVGVQTEEIDAAEVARDVAVCGPGTVRRLRLRGARRVRRRLPDRAGVRGVGAGCGGAGPAGHRDDGPAARRRPGDRGATGRRHRGVGRHRGSGHRRVDRAPAGALRHRRADPRRARADRHDRPWGRARRRCRCSPIWCRCSTSGPEPNGEVLFGNSDLSNVADADPDDYLNRATEEFVDVTVDRVGTRFPGFADATITGSYAGCYDVTPDWNPVISRTGIDGLVVAAGFSGHGFKIAPAVGRLVADLVVDGRSADPRIPESDFRLSRFDEGALLTSPYPYVGAGEMR